MNDNSAKCKCECHTEFARWERFQQAAHLEKQWMNERLNWMLVPQGVLFAALGLIVKELNPCTQDKTNQMIDLAAMVSTLGITLALIGFVGDQERDRKAAKAVGAHFLGVTYGWQFKAEDEGPALVDERDKIVTYIKSINVKSKG